MRIKGSRTSVLIIALWMGLGISHSQDRPKSSEPFIAVSKSQLAETASSSQLEKLKQIENLRTTKEVFIFRRNPDAEIGDSVRISIPNETSFLLSKTGGENRDQSNFTWFGDLQGEKRGTATLIARNGEITGSINSSRGLYRIFPLGSGTYAVVKLNTGGLPPDEPHS
jgi:hypothetical protein